MIFSCPITPAENRLPIRVELQALTRNDFRRILTEPEASLIKQYVALLALGISAAFTAPWLPAALVAVYLAQLRAGASQV